MNTFLPIFPEISLLFLGILLLVVDPFIKKSEKRIKLLGWISAGGLFLTLLLSLTFARPSTPEFTYGGMIRFDFFGFLVSEIVLLSAAITSLLFIHAENLQDRAEAYLLLIVAAMGMCFMAVSSDLIMIYLAIEMTSIPLYLLAGFLKNEDKSIESGFKYLLFGALTSAVFLYGLSLMFGFTGETNIYNLGKYFSTTNLLSVTIVFLLTVGLSFKVSLFPFHFWSPDVYEGAPTPVTGFLSTASKVAGFAVIMRLLLAVFPQMGSSWSTILAILAALTMTVGNFIALAQKSVKRLLAYSSIAHAGYAMVGVVAFSQLGMASAIFYLIAYVFTNLLAFGLVYIVGQNTHSEDFDSYNGLSRRNASLGLASLVAFLSLAGMPPFAGFVAKFLVFSAAIQSGWVWLAIVGILNSIVGLYYYLNILKHVYLYRSDDEQEEKNPIHLPKSVIAGFIILVAGVIVIGTVFGPWFGAATKAIANIY